MCVGNKFIFGFSAKHFPINSSTLLNLNISMISNIKISVSFFSLCSIPQWDMNYVLGIQCVG